MGTDWRVTRRMVAVSPRPVLCFDAGDALYFAVVSDELESSARGAAARVLAECAARAMTESERKSEWPGRLAAQITAQLSARKEGDPAWLLFAAGVLLSGQEERASSEERGEAGKRIHNADHRPAAVHVCTAGDLRIHLLGAQKLLRSTRDHILAHEPPDWIRQTYGEISLQHHGTMITRNLGNCALPPACETWPLDVDASIVVCSSSFHRHREPVDYESQLTAGIGARADPGILLTISVFGDEESDRR